MLCYVICFEMFSGGGGGGGGGGGFKISPRAPTEPAFS